MIGTRLRRKTAAVLAHAAALLLLAAGVAEVGAWPAHVVDVPLEPRLVGQQLRLLQHRLDGQLLEKLWDIDEKYVDEHTLTTSISRIRSKIESDGGAPYIKTVYGMGYQWTGGEAK